MRPLHRSLHALRTDEPQPLLWQQPETCIAMSTSHQGFSLMVSPLKPDYMVVEHSGRYKHVNRSSSLVGHLKKEPLRHLGYRLLERAEILLLTKPPSLHNYHFYLQGRGEYFYRWRDHYEFALEMAIDAYSRQIQIAPEAARAFEADESLGFLPGHAGYRQMRIIEEKRGNLDAARTLCLKAKAEGWNDDWDKQIERIDKKIAR